MPRTLPPPPPLLEGQVLAPNHPDYEKSRSIYLCEGTPTVILRPQTRTALRAAMRYASELRLAEGLPFGLRSGGHGLFGASTNAKGIVLDLSAFRSLRLGIDGEISVGTGAIWGEVHQRLSEDNLLLGAGNFGGIGVGGLTMHGGIGPLVRRQGLTLDRLRRADVVLPTGEILTASATQNPELFWGLRGGAGQVGVVIDCTFAPLSAPLGLLLQHNLMQEVERFGPYLEAWAAVIRSAPKALTSSLTLYPQSGLTYAQMTNIWASEARPDPFFNALEALAPLVDTSLQHHTYAEIVPGGRSAHYGQQAIKLRNGLYDSASADLGQAITSLLQHAEVTLVEVRALGGAMKEVDAEATAFCHRTQEVMVAAWFHPVPETRVDELWAPLAQRASGIYAGYTTDRASDLAQKIWPGATGERLKACAQTYDPQGLLTDGLSLRR